MYNANQQLVEITMILYNSTSTHAEHISHRHVDYYSSARKIYKKPTFNTVTNTHTHTHRQTQTDNTTML